MSKRHDNESTLIQNCFAIESLFRRFINFD